MSSFFFFIERVAVIEWTQVVNENTWDANDQLITQRIS